MATRPERIPRIPSVLELENATDREALFSKWENDSELVRQRNTELFNKDMRLIGLCAFLSGMLGGNLDHHFKWCPKPTWDAHWKSQGFPELSLAPHVHH